MQQIGSDPSRFPVPVRVVRHRENDAKVLLLLELCELVEKCGRGAVAVRVDERHAMRKLLLGDVAQHAPENGDADPAGDEDIWTIGVLGKQEVSLRLLHVDLGSNGELCERTLERAVTEAGTEAEDSTLVRRGDDGDVSPRALLVVIGRIEERHPEVLTGAEVDLGPEQVEHHEQGAFGDLALLLDLRAHRSKYRCSGEDERRIRCYPHQGRDEQPDRFHRGHPARPCRPGGLARVAAPTGQRHERQALVTGIAG